MSKKKYSDEVADIMNSIPNSILRWGLVVIFSVFILILFGAYFIQYPETISESIVLIGSSNKEGARIEEIPCEYTIIYPIRESNLMKIKTGQAVHVKLNAYPYQEYGFLTGEVNSIYFDSITNNHQAIIVLPYGLKTSSNFTVSYYRGMSGTADIITKKRRIIDLVFRFVAP